MIRDTPFPDSNIPLNTRITPVPTSNYRNRIRVHFMLITKVFPKFIYFELTAINTSMLGNIH